MLNRRKTKKVKVGKIFIGGFSPISVQSMTNTDTKDVKSTVKQIWQLEEAGCDIVRVAVPNMEAAEAVKEIRKYISVPLVADIHFDYRLALKCMENGVDKIRINPGNIGNIKRVEKIVKMAKEMHIPIRIGVNSGSLEKDLLKRYGEPTPEAMVESAFRHIRILEDLEFYDIIISLKASSVPMTIEAYRIMSERSDYPLHLGVTEAGTIYSGTIKSAIGIGTLLSEGIGDTLRVSLTGDPVEEVKVGREILKSLGLIKSGIQIISCPTCGRTKIDMIAIAEKVENAVKYIKKDITVAVMGCSVNGPGEAREADIGIAGGDGCALLFKKGEIIRKIPEEKIVEELLREIEDILLPS